MQALRSRIAELEYSNAKLKLDLQVSCFVTPDNIVMQGCIEGARIDFAPSRLLEYRQLRHPHSIAFENFNIVACL